MSDEDDLEAEVSRDEVALEPDQQYDLVEACSTEPYLELFARAERPGWAVWGNQSDETYAPTCKTYSYNSAYVRDLALESWP